MAESPAGTEKETGFPAPGWRDTWLALSDVELPLGAESVNSGRSRITAGWLTTFAGFVGDGANPEVRFGSTGKFGAGGAEGVAPVAGAGIRISGVGCGEVDPMIGPGGQAQHGRFWQALYR